MPTRIARAKRPARRHRYGNRDDEQLIRSAMADLGVSQAELGERLGLTQGAISHMVVQERPLTFLARFRLEYLMAAHEAGVLASGFEIGIDVDFTCNAQLGTTVEFLEHLPTCSRCLARAAEMRRIMPRP